MSCGGPIVIYVPAQDKLAFVSPVNPLFTVPVQDKVVSVPPRT